MLSDLNYSASHLYFRRGLKTVLFTRY